MLGLFESLVERDGNSTVVCVECDTSAQVVCPQCPSGQSCQFKVPTDCTSCLQAVCVSADASSERTGDGGGGSNTGAIAGGVVGGVALIAVVTYLVWRFCVKTRRQQIEQREWQGEMDSSRNSEMSFTKKRNIRASTHTNHSIAETVLTRASNIIQIAYIPGVTNRPGATPTSPTVLVPPVPPIPLSGSQASSPAATEDQHFFVPGNLRDSTYSGISGYTDRTSYARTSYAARSSVASTIYGTNAVIVAPAQTGMRAKPAMVSVKSANSNGLAPPVPAINYEKYADESTKSADRPALSTFTVGSTFINNANAQMATPGRAVLVRMNSTSAKHGPLGPKKLDDSLKLRHDSDTINTLSFTDQGPFSDPPKSSLTSATSKPSPDIEEEAFGPASQRDSTTYNEKNRGRSPFGDEHATEK